MKTEPEPVTTKFRVYDSDLELEYPQHNIYACMYEPIWQWTRYGLQFSTLEFARQACALLDAYVMKSPAEELQYRVWRVFILLCSIPHNKVAPKTQIKTIERYATELLEQQADVYRNKVAEIGKPASWDWALTRANARIMYQNQPEMLLRPLEKIGAIRGRRRHPKHMYVHYRDICVSVMSGVI